MKTIAAAVLEGFTINYHAPGRPRGYKGETFQPTDAVNLFTNLEADLICQMQKIIEAGNEKKPWKVRSMLILAKKAIERAEPCAGDLYDQQQIGSNIAGRVDGITAGGDIIEHKTTTKGECYEPDPSNRA